MKLVRGTIHLPRCAISVTLTVQALVPDGPTTVRTIVDIEHSASRIIDNDYKLEYTNSMDLAFNAAQLYQYF